MTDEDDATRFAAFYRNNYSLILATCFRRLGSRPAAEDAAAEVFRIVWQRYSKETPALPTLYAIARNVVGNEYRRGTRARAVHARLEQAEATKAPDDESMELRDALLRLRPTDREVLYMAYWEDLTAKEMAEILRPSSGAVWVRLSRAREALREVLAADVSPRGERHG